MLDWFLSLPAEVQFFVSALFGIVLGALFVGVVDVVTPNDLV